MKEKIIKTFSLMMILILISKGMGFVRESLVAATYGADLISDLYVFEDGLLNAIYTVCAGVIGTTYIPKLLSFPEEDRSRFSSNYMNIMLLIILGITLLVMIFTEPILKILLPGFFYTYDTIIMQNIIFLTRINMVSLVLIFLENYLIATLQANKYFIFSSIQGIILNSFLIIYLLQMSKLGIAGIIGCKIFVHLLNVLFLLCFIRKKKIFKYHFFLNMKVPYIKEIARLSIPVVIVNIVSQFNYIVDRSMASVLESGSMSLLSYSNTIASLLYSVIGVALCSMSYTDIGMAQNNSQEVIHVFNKYKNILINILFPCALAMVLCSDQICSIVYGYGHVSTVNIEVLSNILILYVPSNVALSIRDLYNRFLYVNKKNRIPAYINIIGLFSNIILNIILAKLLGIYGLALATSITSIVTLFITVRYCKSYVEKDYSMGVIKLICKCIGSFIVVKWIITLFPIDTLYTNLIVVLCSGGASLVIFNINDLKQFLRGKA